MLRLVFKEPSTGRSHWADLSLLPGHDRKPATRRLKAGHWHQPQPAPRLDWKFETQKARAQPARVVMIRPQSWERYGLKAWIEAAKKRLHHNVLAIALANKLARIAQAVLNKERYFEVTRTTAPSPQPA